MFVPVVFVHGDLFEICPSCNKDSSFYDYGYDKYFRTKVSLVLDQIHEQAISCSERQWVTVICDGVFGATIQDNMAECEECRK